MYAKVNKRATPAAGERTLARYVGERVKEHRARRRYSLRELAGRAGVSAAMISEIERGKKSPTIEVLTAIATALEVPTSYLFERAQDLVGISVVRRREHRVINIAPGTINVVLGHPLKGSNLHFVRLELRRGAGRDIIGSHPVGSIERAHVAEGSVELTVGDRKVRLEAGDSSSFIADRPHNYRNVGSSTAKVYLVVEFGNE